ncbi:MAG TPA: hypothetical protein VFS59_14970 [Gemmatimonadaceae bacterium]|nr:hypothetical protein [Gemmatimonadaceae bacterium]
MGFPRNGLLTTASSMAAASAWRAAAVPSTPLRCAPALSSSTENHSNVRRDGAPFARARRVATCPYPLLHPRSGRHDHDVGRATIGHASASRRAGDIAVKNLRIIGSAVLLLNFDEVGDIHLCSTGVTV